jgi:hypothetical protein
MLKILGKIKKPSRRRQALHVYNGVHIFYNVRKYIYIQEKRDENTWLLNVLLCGYHTVVYILTFHHCHCSVRGVTKDGGDGAGYEDNDADMDIRYGTFCTYDIRTYVALCVRNFTKGETIVEFTKRNGFLYSLNFITAIKCRVEEWRAIMGC